MPMSKKHRTDKNPKASSADAQLPNAATIQAAYQRNLPLALALPESDIETLTADPSLCYQNVLLGLEAVLKYEDEVKKLPTRWTMKELRQLPDIALALIFASMQVNRRSTGEVADVRKQAVELRQLLMPAVKMLVGSGDVPARTFEAIRRGRGPRDTAQDCVALATILSDESLRKKTSVTAAQVALASQVGTQLLTVVRPPGSRQPTRGEAAAAQSVAIRDRLWTLLNQQHTELRRIGMWLFMDEVDAHVPSLRSRRRSATGAAAAPTAPAPQPSSTSVEPTQP